MTDNEIIKALECCPKAEMTVDCKALGCPVYQKKGCGYVLNCDLDSTTDAIIEGLSKDALDLINRQQAEIERLAKGCGIITEEDENWYPSPLKTPEEIKVEAVNELIEKLTEEYKDYTLADSISINRIFLSIKHIAKRMVGEG